jgi:hypothetical protein
MGKASFFLQNKKNRGTNALASPNYLAVSLTPYIYYM